MSAAHAARAWVFFGLLSGLLLAAAAWLGVSAWRADLREQRAGHALGFEQQVQTALWRMEAAASGLIARESARSPAEVDRLTGDALRQAGTGFVAQAPGGAAPAPRYYANPAQDGELLAQRRSFNKQNLDWNTNLNQAANPKWDGIPQDGQQALNQPAQQLKAQQSASYGNRSQANQAYNDIQQMEADSPTLSNGFACLPKADELTLARQVQINGRERMQGFQLDVPQTQGWLLGLVQADFPHGRLALDPALPPADPARTLVALPLRFDPGPLPPFEAAWTPLRSAIAGAGLAVLVTLGALALVLERTLALARRQAEFTSAVTHELRTPLTTVRLYTDLLAATGDDPAARARHLGVLEREAERLSALVDNVLTFARLERRAKPDAGAAQPVAALLERLRPRLEERTGRCGLALAGDFAGPEAGADGLTVLADPQMVEQILLNLVDNACKYAADGRERRLELRIEAEPKAVVFTVRDFGPGLDAPARRRLFHPFSRPDSAAAASGIPGVGLGLALCRRLARSMGGRLTHSDPAGGGAAFHLRLRRAP